jgi:HSP20 family molecular chaperone IbpA
MSHELQPHSDSPRLPVDGLTAEARRREGGKLELVYRLSGELEALLIPELSNPNRADELWKHTCFEIFILQAEVPGYVEFNFAPTGQWAAYSFRSRRSGMRNIEQVGEQGLRITLAVAGFSMSDLDIEVETNQLTVRGKQSEDEARVYLHRGIAGRQFQRSFVLADGIEVLGASLDHGLLHIDMKRVEPESTARKIPIAGGGTRNGKPQGPQAIDVNDIGS